MDSGHTHISVCVCVQLSALFKAMLVSSEKESNASNARHPHLQQLMDSDWFSLTR